MTSIKDDALIDFVLNLSSDTGRQKIESEMLVSESLCKRIVQWRNALAEVGSHCPLTSPSIDVRHRILRTIEPASRFEGFVRRLCDFLDVNSETVRKILNSIDSAGQDWSQTGFPGVLMLPFKAGNRHESSECALIWVESGSVFPNHRHLGDEWGIVLQGTAREDSGCEYNPGDIVYKKSGSSHTVSSIANMPLISIVIHQGVKFAGKPGTT